MEEYIWDVILYSKKEKVHYVIDNKEYENVDQWTLLKLLEDDNYMFDYFPSEDGKEVEIRFDNIENCLTNKL